MKVQITFGANELCDICEKSTDCVNLYRAARKGEREHFFVNVCKDCIGRMLGTYIKHDHKGLPQLHRTT